MCLLIGRFCVRGQCILCPDLHPIDRRRFSDDPQHCDPECPAHLACLGGQCVDGRRRFQGLSRCSRGDQCGPFQTCFCGQCKDF
ncbi:hypothetical protein B9Z55_022755 [Caenorhabditis nigoni]|uniref:Uncharacterized protein n=1 Tax=Caenorhabditis nigoni TaxID=1611254 RepID=A0A2G5SM36_9PELO|nr:hypothetical protein B9Z55_022755 [Caenorhabditis nigoni]